jgi:signal transduction histidine kinase
MQPALSAPPAPGPVPAIGTWDLDPAAERVRYAPEFKQRLGMESALEYDPTSHWRSRVHPDDLGPMRDALFAHIDGRAQGYLMQFRLRCNHGGYRWVLSCGQAVARDAHGRALRVMGTLTDLSELHETALKRAQTEVHARVSHDLRTPLNVVLGFSQLMQGQIGSGNLEVQRRHLAHIEQGGWQLLDQVDRLLAAPRQHQVQGAGDTGGGSRTSS